MFIFRIFLFLFLGAILEAKAAPLGTVPSVDTDYIRIQLDLRSDVWSSPNTYKKSPVRVFSSELLIPIFHGNDWRFSAQIADESLSLSRTEFSLKDRNIFIGNNLQSQSAGFGFSRLGSAGSSFTATGLFATASDEPSFGNQDRYFDGSFIYQSAPIGPYRALLAINQSDNRGLYNGRPFPFIGLVYQENEDFQLRIGLPFLRALWQKKDVYRYEAQLTPFGAFLDTQRPLTKGFLWHARASFTMRSYLYANRIQDENRLFYQETAIEGGLRRPISDSTMVELSLGYAFNRRLFESDSLYKSQNDKTSLDSDFLARFRIGFTVL